MARRISTHDQTAIMQDAISLNKVCGQSISTHWQFEEWFLFSSQKCCIELDLVFSCCKLFFCGNFSTWKWTL